MKRLVFGVMALSLLVLGGCPGGGGSDVDVPDSVDTGDSDVTPDGDVSPDSDAEVGPDVDACEGAAELEFWFAGRDGVIGRDEASVTLFPEDEPVQFEATPGFQIGVVVSTRCVPAGTNITLTVPGRAQQMLPISVTGVDGMVTFGGITLQPSVPPGETISVEATVGTETVSDSKAVVVRTDTCDIELAPASADGCLTEDADPIAPGTQLTFTVTNPDGRCDRATLAFGPDLDTLGTPAELPLVSGAATFTITADPSDDPAELELVFEATVLHPTSAALAGAITDTYTVDQLPPAIVLTSPDPDLSPFNITADANADPSDGLQLDVAGTVDGQMGDLTLFVDGAEVATTTPDGATFLFEAVTFTGNGAVAIAVRGVDACGNAGEGTSEIDVFAEQPELEIVSPADATVLKALADGDSGTPNAFETTFQVQATGLVSGATLGVACREAGTENVFDPAGSIEVDAANLPANNTFSIPVVLQVSTLTRNAECRAAVDLPNPAASAAVTLTIGLPAPTLSLSAPADNALLNTKTVTFEGEGTGLDGQPITVRVFPAAGGDAICEVTGGAVDAGIFAVAIDLDAECGGLADGSYFLQVDAADQYGNLISELGPPPSTTVSIDTAAPGLQRDAPDATILDPMANPAHADSAPLVPGYQTDFTYSLTGETVAAGAEICLSVGGSALGCKPADAVSFSATWADVTLDSGDNAVSATATDAYGNPGSLDETIELLLAAPVVKIQSPAADLITPASTLDVVVRVSEPGTDAPLGGATTTLLVDGVDSGIAPVAGGDGVFTFPAVSLVENTAVSIQAVADFSGEEGASGVRSVTWKSVLPTVAITNLSDGQVINLATDACAGTAANCTLGVEVATADAEDGSALSIAIDCAGTLGDTSFDGTVSADAGTVSDVVLLHGGVCILTPEVTDAAGQVVAGTAVSVTVDRVAPRLLAYVNPAGDKLLFNQDANANPDDGMQHPLSVRVTGVEMGQVVEVTLTWEDPVTGPQSLGPLTHTVAQTVLDPNPYVATFVDPPGSGTVTYPEGLITLTTTIVDAAGNTAQGSKLVRVESFAPSIRIVFPLYLGEATCDAGNPCTSGTCHEGKCWNQWGVAETKQVKIALGGVITTTDNVRVCSDHASLDGVGEACTGDGFFEVVRTSVAEDDAFVALGGLLPDGFQTLIAEVQAEPEGPWVPSLVEVSALDRFRRVLVDSTVPTVTNIEIVSDTLDPVGTLNVDEQFAPGRTYSIKVTADDEGTVRLFSNGQQRGSKVTSGGIASLNVQLDEGANTIYATVTDAAANKSGVPPATLVKSVTVDTVVPSLAFSNPTGSPVIAGDVLDVVLDSDTDGATVTLFDELVEVGSETVVGGQAIFDDATYGTLSEGVHALSATVVSAAGNAFTVASSPASILVDTVLPSGVLTAPVAATTFAAGDDADPAAAGFQVAVDFTTADGAATWELWVATGCDASFQGCGAANLGASGTVTNAGGAEPTELLTISIPQAMSNQVITLRVRDAVDNPFDTSVGVSFDIDSCLTSFLDLPAGTWFNIEDCDGGVPCAQASIQLSGEFFGPCGDVSELRLMNGAVMLGSEVPNGTGGAGATFDVTLNDGVTLNLELKAFAGGTEVGSTGVTVKKVDFTPPAVTLKATSVSGFMTPASGAEVTYNAGQDASTSTAGFQGHLSVDLADLNITGGRLLSVVATGVGGDTTLTPTNVTLPSTITAPSPLNRELRNLTYADQATSTITVTAEDAAGNVGTASFTATVDIVAPTAIALDAIVADNVDKRLPAVPLTWTAVGDNGVAGGAAEAYDIRYSRSAITTLTEFNEACQVSLLAQTGDLPTPATPGTAEGYTVSGPDPRALDVAENGKPCKFAADQSGAPYFFAIRVSDDAGNWSPLSAATPSVSTDAVAVETTRVNFAGTGLSGFLPFNVAHIGDVDNDGDADFAVGSNPANAACIVFGPVTEDFSPVGLSSAQHTCVAGATLTTFLGLGAVSNFGAMINSLGDVNGDGISDFGATGNVNGGGFMAIFLGVQDAGPDLNNPNVVIVGADPDGTVPYGAGCGAGNFNGDLNGGVPIDDIAVGEPGATANQIHIISGRSVWTGAGPTPTSIVIDLDVPGDFNAFVDLTIFAANASMPKFGARCQAAGDLLPTPGGGAVATGDLLVHQSGNDDARVFVIPGRTFPAADALEEVTLLTGTKTDEDNRSVRLRQDNAATVSNGFGVTFQGRVDLTGDGVTDVLVGQTSHANKREIYVFDGTIIPTKVGLDLRVGGTTKVGDSWVGPNGYAVETDAAGGFRGVQSVGNWDGWELDGVAGPVPTADLIFGVGGAPFNSMARVRFNHETDDGTVELGMFPYADIELINPDVAPAFFTFGPPFDGGADFTGDGRTDILVGTGAGSVYLIK